MTTKNVQTNLTNELMIAEGGELYKINLTTNQIKKKLFQIFVHFE